MNTPTIPAESPMANPTEPAPKAEFTNVPLRIPRDLDDRLKAASDETHVSKQDLMRLSIERGLESLLAALTGKAA